MATRERRVKDPASRHFLGLPAHGSTTPEVAFFVGEGRLLQGSTTSEVGLGEPLAAEGTVDDPDGARNGVAVPAPDPASEAAGSGCAGASGGDAAELDGGGGVASACDLVGSPEAGAAPEPESTRARTETTTSASTATAAPA